MRKFAAAWFAAAALAGMPSFAMAAPAADPQVTAAVKVLLDAMDVREAMAASAAAMEEAMPSMMRSQIAGMIQNDPDRTAEQKRQALAKLEEMLPVVARASGKVLRDPAVVDEMIAEMVPLYANNYSLDEIRQLTAFYRTPLGRKMMALTPRLAAESMAIGQRVMLPRLGKLMQEVAQDVQKP
jgi:hypothetical protein